MSAMSNSVKTKFAGLLRGLLRRLDDNEAPASQTLRPLAAAVPPPVTVVPATPLAEATAFEPLPETNGAGSAPAANPDELQLPLQSILTALPMDLRAKVMQNPPVGMMVSLPLEKVLTQLAFGSVKITFGELRQAAPGVFVNSGGGNDPKQVTLPLNEILSRLNPVLLSRRPAQKQMEVAEGITGPFGAGGAGVTISKITKPTPSTTLTSKGTPPLRVVAPPAPGPTPTQPAPVAPPPPAFVPRATTPPPAVQTPLPPPSMPHPETTTIRLAPPRSNGAPKPVIPAPAPAAPAAKPTPAIPAVKIAPAAEAPVESAISAPLAALCEGWPEGLRLEIRQSNLADAQVLLPLNQVEPALKRGRMTLAWRNLRSLIKPTPPPSAHDATEVELPLHVIAPLFFSRHKTAPQQTKQERPPAEIPNLFFGFPQPEPVQPEPPVKMPAPTPPRPRPEPQAIPFDLEPPVFQPKSAPAPVPPQPKPEPLRLAPETPKPRPALKPVDAKLADTNYYIWGENGEAPRTDETEYKRNVRPATDFTSRYATPQEVVERAMALPGVAGALVALPDGLKVASQTPSDLNADTLAAFLPQIFDRVGQSTRELRMGTLNNFHFTVGNVPWRIFRVNAVYFAAFGHAGESLPAAQLAALAAELDRKK